MKAEINNILRNMRQQGKLKNIQAKGDAGEDAALLVVKELYSKLGGTLYQSYKYPYQSNRDGLVYLGNIKYVNNKYVQYTDSSIIDEIDILYVHSNRIMPIEIKSYRGDMSITDEWMYTGVTPMDKSPIMQSEKHARHLYHAIYEYLPDGDPAYIQPITCFVDNCRIDDKRAENLLTYIKCCTLDTLKKTVVEACSPLQYLIDVKGVESKLRELQVDATTRGVNI